jgi:hypothetical protein
MHTNNLDSKSLQLLSKLDETFLGSILLFCLQKMVCVVKFGVHCPALPTYNFLYVLNISIETTKLNQRGRNLRKVTGTTRGRSQVKL